MDITKAGLVNKRWIIIPVIIWFILLLSWFVLREFTSINPSEASEIQQLILRSVEINQTSMILPEPYCSNPDARVLDEVKKKANENIEDKLSRFYIPKSQMSEKMVGFAANRTLIEQNGESIYE